MISKACRVNTHLKIQMDSNGFKWNSNGIQMEFKWRSAVFYYVFGHFHDLSTSCSADISVSQTSQNSNGFKWIQMEFKWNTNGEVLCFTMFFTTFTVCKPEGLSGCGIGRREQPYRLCYVILQM